MPSPTVTDRLSLTEGFDTRDLKEAKALLVQLSASGDRLLGRRK
jgi:hypothetical protein